MIQRKLAEYTVSAYDELAADADEDGSVAIIDATMIQRYLADYSDINDIGKEKPREA